jgi:hypothetical protein
MTHLSFFSTSLLKACKPPQQKKRNELWKTLFHERVCKWVRCVASFDDGGGEGIIYKAWTKEEGQRKYGRKGHCNFV